MPVRHDVLLPKKGHQWEKQNYHTGIPERSSKISTILGSGTTGLLFGNGVDGDKTLSTSYDMPSDKYYEDLTLTTANGIIDTKGFRLFVNGTLKIDGGKIQNNGDGTVLSSGGGGGDAGTLAGGANGGDYLAVGGSVTCSLGGAGGAGTSQAGGSVTAPTAIQGGTEIANNVSNTILGIVAGSFYQRFTGGSGGGGGIDHGGGGGGGICLVVARNIEVGSLNGTIRANGGNGKDDDSGGGGGGGGGGVVIVITTKVSGSGTLTRAADGGPSDSASAGSAGNTYLIEV